MTVRSQSSPDLIRESIVFYDVVDCPVTSDNDIIKIYRGLLMFS